MDWKVFVCGNDVEQLMHVVPVTPDGEPKKPHVLSEFCCCRPEQDKDDPDVYVHNMLH